jgi:galactonate dehydratase
MNARRLKLQNWIALQSASAGSDPKQHVVSEVRTWSVREPVSGRVWTAVRLRTTSGLTGWGEAGRVPPGELAKARSALNGKPATAWATIETGTALDPGIQMALLDISARAASAPVYRLLGGPTRFKVRALTTLEGATEAELAASMARGREAGYRAFQVPLPATKARNQGQAFHEAVRYRMNQLRSAAPAGVNFVLDGGGKLSAGDAGGIAALLERFHLLWFDEPASVSNLQTLRKISEESVTPLGFGRTVHDAPVFQDLLRQGSADILRPSLQHTAIPAIRRIAALAETYYVAVAPNHDGGPIASAAAIHLAAALPNFFIQHVPLPAAEQDRRMRSAILRQPVESVRDGFLPLPTGPGLGVEVDEEALERYKEQA